MLIIVFRYQAPAQSDQSKPQYQPQQGRQARLPYNAYGEGNALNFLDDLNLSMLVGFIITPCD